MRTFKIIKKIPGLIFNPPKGLNRYCYSLFSSFFKLKKPLGLPVHITIEPINSCNLKCPVCETGSGELKRAKREMALEDFKAIVDKIYRHTNSIFFYFMGEPFLNKNAYGMIKYAKSKNIYLTTCTNGHFIDPYNLVNSGIDEVSFQIGGIDQDTHKIYREGSNLDEILKKIEEVLHERGKLRLTTPKIILGFILMKHNENQLDGFYKLAKKMGVDEARILNPCVRNFNQGVKFLPENKEYWIYDVKAFEKGVLKPKNRVSNSCNWIYLSAVILSNGDVVPCCHDTQGQYVMGNILKQDLASIWGGNKYTEFREELAKNKGSISICKLCPGVPIPGLYSIKKKE